MFMIPHALAVVLAMNPVASPDSPAPSPTPTPAPSAPVVVLETTLGAIHVRLNPDKAPITVSNFLQYVEKRHYDGTIFHRVIPGFMIQGGGLKSDMAQKPTLPPIRNESANGLSNRRGTIAMARTGAPDSATSQFFINVNDNAGLDSQADKPGYAVFGEVVEGMEVVDRIVSAPTEQRGMHKNVPVTPVVILSVRLASQAPPAAAPGK